ncbi:hypothetical protein AK812_SmicGene31262 [Symbiodinium microadriaticum]|uniref:Uncharacterized protein n=1 Tax=Symbiodinium microadriaticum TaxID=2951 RepID=A0A1Q9CX71_SYMMI|nr:hypothetical protein AK812_SmicGene31262 [Symbiodinium microadriaticum]
MKRRAPENEGTALTLETIREAIGEAIRGELQEVRQDIRHFATRVDHVESQVTKQMQQTINLLDEMTHKHAEHGGILQQLPEANREVRSRLEQLGGEYCCTILRWGRPPALVIGGWDPDQDAKVTKSEAEDILKSVGAPIYLDSMFVPGVRRGYAILPIDTRPGESFEERNYTGDCNGAGQ